MHIKSDGQKIAQEFKLYRKEHGLSQVQLAGKLDISVRTISRIESGNGCSKDIWMSFRLLQKNLSSIEVIYDYLKIRVHCSSVETAVCGVLEMDMNEFQISSRYHPGYDLTYKHYSNNGILLHCTKEHSDNGVMIELQGSGCRYYESLLCSRNSTWLEYFERCQNYGANATRIDIAIDDYVCMLSIPKLIKKYRNEELRTSFKTVDPREPTDNNLNSKGLSLYLGEYGSECHWCFYAKDMELLNKKKISRIEDSLVKNRFEVCLRRKKADEVFRMITSGTPMESIPFRLLEASVSFLDKNKDKDKEKWLVNGEWKKFVGSVSKLKLNTDSKMENTILKKLIHFERSYGAVYYAFKRLDDELGTTVLHDMYNRVASQQSNKAEKYFKLAEQHILANEDSNTLLEMN